MAKSVEELCTQDCLLIAPWIGIDLAQQGVWRGTRFIPLPARTFAILSCLSHHPNTVVAIDHLLAVGWPGEPHVPSDLSRHIHRIRQAIEIHPSHPRILVNRRGVGYCFRDGA